MTNDSHNTSSPELRPLESITPPEIYKELQKGVLGEYPVTDIKVTVVDGKYHEVDSSDIAFRTAASMAFKDGMRIGLKNTAVHKGTGITFICIAQNIFDSCRTFTRKLPL